MPAKHIDQIEQTISIEEFMARCGVKSRSTVHRWLRERYVKSAKVGRRRRFPVSEVERVLKGKYGL